MIKHHGAMSLAHLYLNVYAELYFSSINKNLAKANYPIYKINRPKRHLHNTNICVHLP
jgi:hypothetical protein